MARKKTFSTIKPGYSYSPEFLKLLHSNNSNDFWKNVALGSYKLRFITAKCFSNSKYNSFYDKYNLKRDIGPQQQICYAPEKSMLFNKDGNVTACCLSKSGILGNIKENTIAEIWDSKEINSLRQELKNNDLSRFCNGCKYKIESGNTDAADSAIFDLMPFMEGKPSNLEFELSNECNLECIMCAPDFSSSISRKIHGKNLFPGVYGDDFLKQLDDFIPYLYSSKFLGGEPFLIPIYYKIWDKIIEQNPGCIIVVQTNATLLNKKITDLLEKGSFQICISVESFRKETYEKIRKNADFDTVMRNISYYAEHARRNKYLLGISVCPMQQNWQELPEIITRANELGARVYFNTVWTPENCSLYSLNENNLSLIVKKLASFALPESTSLEKQNKFHYQCLINQLRVWQIEKSTKPENVSLPILQQEDKQKLWENNKTMLEQKSVGELCAMIIDKIKKERTATSITDEDFAMLDYYQSKLLATLSVFEHNEQIKRVLFNFMQKPAQEIFHILKDVEKDDFLMNFNNKLAKFEKK